MVQMGRIKNVNGWEKMETKCVLQMQMLIFRINLYNDFDRISYLLARNSIKPNVK